MWRTVCSFGKRSTTSGGYFVGRVPVHLLQPSSRWAAKAESSPKIPWEHSKRISTTHGKLTWPAIDNGHLQWIFPLKMVIFHSYVSLPEGRSYKWWVNHQPTGENPPPNIHQLRRWGAPRASNKAKSRPGIPTATKVGVESTAKMTVRNNKNNNTSSSSNKNNQIPAGYQSI